MRLNHTGSVLALCLGVATFASPARADEETRAMIKDEIKAYMDAQKAKDKEKKEKDDAEKKEKDKQTFKVSWKEGIRFESGDKNFKVKLGGRIQNDWYGIIDADEDLETAIEDEFDSAVFFRRARLGIEMEIYKYGRAKAEFDFAASGRPSFTDVYVGLGGLHECWCWAPDLQVGHFKEPYGLEELTSSKYITFLERSSATNAFAPSRNTGAMISKNAWGDRILWQLGYFGNSNDFGEHVWNDDGEDTFSGDADGWNATARLVVVPWYDCACPDCRVLHLGASYSRRDDISSTRFRARPETGYGPRVIDTGTFDAEAVNLFGAEVAFVYDAFSIQGEYFMADVDSTVADDPSYTGWYVMASWFLTGECRAYERGKGAFGRIKPCRNFLGENCCGAGAWELAARWSTVDLEDGAVDGGTISDLTVGVNWYLNPNMRVQLNYVWADVENSFGTGLDGEVSFIAVRFQADW